MSKQIKLTIELTSTHTHRHIQSHVEQPTNNWSKKRLRKRVFWIRKRCGRNRLMDKKMETRKRCWKRVPSTRPQVCLCVWSWAGRGRMHFIREIKKWTQAGPNIESLLDTRKPNRRRYAYIVENRNKSTIKGAQVTMKQCNRQTVVELRPGIKRKKYIADKQICQKRRTVWGQVNRLEEDRWWERTVAVSSCRTIDSCGRLCGFGMNGWPKREGQLFCIGEKRVDGKMRERRSRERTDRPTEEVIKDGQPKKNMRIERVKDVNDRPTQNLQKGQYKKWDQFGRSNVIREEIIRLWYGIYENRWFQTHTHTRATGAVIVFKFEKKKFFSSLRWIGLEVIRCQQNKQTHTHTRTQTSFHANIKQKINEMQLQMR